MAAAADGAGACRLLAGASGIAMQFLLLFCALAGLLWKRQREARRGEQRPLSVWVLDVSKQGFSGGAAHASGMLWAVILQGAAVSSPRAFTSECSWYLVVFVVDTTLGVVVTIALHKLIVAWVRRTRTKVRRWIDPVADCGKYGLTQWPPDSPAAPAAVRSSSGGAVPGPSGTGKARLSPGATSQIAWDSVQLAGLGEPVLLGSRPGEPRLADMCRSWLPQMAEWVLCTVLGRLVSGGAVLCVHPVLHSLAGGIDQIFDGQPDLELLSVMVAGPLLMNVAQAWVQDTYLRFRAAAAASAAPPPDKPPGADIV
eukprot:TRINITY_DN9299_c0_g2_i1.p2 TRINITY_DN9299_c0_g2~~TRINITY_DN9299_c0_g2_i1.p2  ORF type:complete len:312 (+),score=59.38 TRINITY_DN9299_c0_g2_i1:85-1020(+)